MDLNLSLSLRASCLFQLPDVVKDRLCRHEASQKNKVLYQRGWINLSSVGYFNQKMIIIIIIESRPKLNYFCLETWLIIAVLLIKFFLSIIFTFSPKPACPSYYIYSLIHFNYLKRGNSRASLISRIANI